MAFALGAVVGVPYYFWTQATAMPSWYQESAIASHRLHDPVVLQRAKQTVAAKVTSAQVQPDGTHEVYLNEQDVTAIALTELNYLAVQTQLTNALQSVGSNIRDGRIEAGAIINLSNLSSDRLNTTEKEIVTLVRQTFPALVEREVYVGIEGKPTMVDGQLQFDDSLRIKVGNLSLSAADVSQKLGISEATLWQTVNRELGVLQVKEVEVSGDQLRLRGTL